MKNRKISANKMLKAQHFQKNKICKISNCFGNKKIKINILTFLPKNKTKIKHLWSSSIRVKSKKIKKIRFIIIYSLGISEHIANG